MAKFAPDAMLDASLNYVAGSTVMHACVGQPANFSAVSTASRASVSMSSGDFTIGAGDTSGRKVTVAAKTGVSVDADGTVDHVVLVDGSTIRYITTCTSQALTEGNTVNFPAWDIEIADPA